jgi:hypothetical protein|eukprot:COSAG06_NODE_12245_length_1404_cov_1.298084_2_plen_91_part_00
MGAAIALGIERGYWVREDLVITTKIFNGATTHARPPCCLPIKLSTDAGRTVPGTAAAARSCALTAADRGPPHLCLTRGTNAAWLLLEKLR